jgi:hypothetical protein
VPDCRQLGSLGEFQDQEIHHEDTKITKKSNMIQRVVCLPPVSAHFSRRVAQHRATRAHWGSGKPFEARLRLHDSIVLCALLRDLRAFVVDLLIS